MANTKISQFPTDTELTGAELLTGIDGSTNKNISLQQIADFVIALIGGTVTPEFILSEDGEDLILSLTGEDFVLTT